MKITKESAIIEYAINSASLHYYKFHATLTAQTREIIELLKYKLRHFGKLSGFTEKEIEENINCKNC